VAPRRSLAGPFVLITLGVIFLLGNIGMLSWGNIGYYFSRWWPLLLILWGLIKLVESWDAQRRGYRARGIGAGGVILVIFVILIGLTASGIAKWGPEIGNNIDDDNDLGLFFGNKYTFADNNSASLPANGSMRIVNDRGDVKVTVSTDDKVHLVTNYVVYSHSQDDAQKAREARAPHFASEGSILVLNSSGSQGVENADRARVNMEVQVPRKAGVEITTQHGDIRVIGRDGDVKAQTAHGDGQVEDVNGKVDFQMRHGDFTANKVSGDLSVDGSVNDVTVNDIGGQLELRGDYYGDVNINRVAKAVRFNSSRTQFELAKLDGQMTMESGDLRVTTLTGPVTLRSRSKDLHLDDMSGDLNVDDTNAQIDVRVTKLPLGNLDISNRNGEIRLTLPANAAFTADAETRNGDIRSDFPEIKVDTSRDTNHASGKVGSGGAMVRLRTEHADIEIRKGP
jgi:DUF4097 and DUF4098 domain-containing protein YvlB